MSIVEKALGKVRVAQTREFEQDPLRDAVARTDEVAGPVASLRNPTRRVTMTASTDEAVGAFWNDSIEPLVANHLRGLRREILARLQPVLERGASPLVLVTSPVPGDGKTFISVAIARTFAKAPDMHVTLVDMDLVRCSSSGLFGAGGQPGLLECAQGKAELADVVCATDVARLNFIPAGVGSGERREVFVGDAMGGLLDQLRHSGPGSVCFLDAPPVLPVVETALLAAKVDLVLLVVRAGETPQAAVQDSLARLGPEAKVAIVLNSATQLHSGEYYDYSHYGPA